jgi:hypothetical protein
MESRWVATHTMLTGHLDQSGLYGVLAHAEALGLERLEVHRLVPTGNREPPVSQPEPVPGESL